MKIKDIPAYVVEINMLPYCEIDDCHYPAEYHYRNDGAYSDAFQVWNLCPDHAGQLDERIAQSRETGDAATGP